MIDDDRKQAEVGNGDDTKLGQRSTYFGQSPSAQLYLGSDEKLTPPSRSPLIR